MINNTLQHVLYLLYALTVLIINNIISKINYG